MSRWWAFWQVQATPWRVAAPSFHFRRYWPWDYPPVAANVTSSVGLLSGYAGGSVAYRRELSGQNSRMLALGVTATLGSIAGALLLLATPGESFRSVVPFLVLLSSLLLLVQPALARRVRESEPAGTTHEVTPLAHLGVMIGAGYGSYFGAGLGVLLLGVLGILLVDDMQRLNGLKTLLSLLIKSVGAAIFVFSGHVSWTHAAVLFLTAYSGGMLGAALRYLQRRVAEGKTEKETFRCLKRARKAYLPLPLADGCSDGQGLTCTNGDGPTSIAAAQSATLPAPRRDPLTMGH